MTDRTHDELVEQLHYAQSAVTALHALSERNDPSGKATGAIAYMAGRLSEHLSAAESGVGSAPTWVTRSGSTGSDSLRTPVPFHLIDPVCSAMHLVEKPAYAIDELAQDILDMRVDDRRRQECCQSAMVGLTRQLIEAIEQLRRAIDRAAGEQTNE